MEKNITLAIEDLKANLVKAVNDSGLPIAVSYYVMKDFYNDFTNEYRAFVAEERTQNVEKTEEEQNS